LRYWRLAFSIEGCKLDPGSASAHANSDVH
jgi:hypothetical protein